MLSLPFAGTMGMMGGGMMGRGMMGGGTMGSMQGMSARMSLPPGAKIPLFSIKVAKRTDRRLPLPHRFAPIARLRPEAAPNAAHPRAFRIGMSRMRWTFNGRGYAMGDVAADEIVKLGTTEVWEFANDRMMAHAIHIHGLQFQVLERLDSPRGDGVVAGCVDEGWEDTVLVMPGERVRVIMRFADFTGVYAYPCHMLEHAADGLMRNYRVQA